MTSTTSQSPPKKRSLFSKQVLAKVSVAKDPVDFFSRAKDVYPKLLQEEEQKRQKRIKEIESNRSARCVGSNEVDDQEGKRRRLDAPEDSVSILNDNHVWTQRDSFSSESGSRETRRPSCDDNNSSLQCQKLRAKNTNDVTKKPSHNASIQPENQIRSKSTQPILLDDDLDDELDDNNDNIPFPPQSPVVDILPETSEEEFPELIQQAREREKLKALRLNAAKLSGGQAPKAQNHSPDDVFDTRPEIATELDPTVELLITSEIEGTKPLRVKRKLSQRLKEARLTWCDKQPIQRDHLGRPLQDVIFLTWRGKRLFDVTTCGSLGIKLDEDGKLSPFKDEADLNENIHLEAWTDETLKISEQKAAANLKEKKDNSDDEGGKQISKSGPPKCKIIMKAKGMEPCKLVVKPTTTIAKIAEAFRKAKSIPENTQITLRFDGDVLDPDSTVQETELGDMDNIDTVEVYLKSK